MMSICDKCERKSECPGAHEDEFCLNYVQKPHTNADRIRAMTDEEMAEWISGMISDCDNNDFPCGKFCPLLHDEYRKNTCLDSMLLWLKQEAEPGAKL